MKKRNKMDTKTLSIVIFAIVTIGSIVLFVLDLNSSRKQDDINNDRLEFEKNQDEINFNTLREIDLLNKQLDLLKSNDSLVIGGEIWTKEELHNYLKKQTDKNNSKLNRALAYYGLGQLKEAEKLFLEALNNYPKNEDKKALINSYLGELYLIIPNKLLQAKKYSLEAYVFYKKNNEDKVDKYLFELGNITSNIGRILKKETDYRGALKYYKESEEIRQRLAKINPQKYLIDLGSIYNNIAVLLRENPELGDPEKMYLKSLKIKRQAAKSNFNYLPTLTTTLNNLGNFYNENKKDFPTAEKYFKEAIEINQFIVDNGNNEYLPNLANNQSGFAFALENEFSSNRKLKYFSESEGWFKKAIGNYNKIQNREIYIREYSNCLHNFARLYKEFNDPKYINNAEKYYKEAFEIRKQLSKSKLPIDEVSLADTQLSLALLYTENIPNKTSALKFANDAIKLYQKNKNFRDSKKWLKVAQKVIEFWNHSS